ncbi:Glucose/arabinose dehydrogenase, beta-propeller fold [Algoriphagus locisalis]|uniref:Glucose/arabinose dehydrogenase, beta-propeller fold n=1 Tax=Algoriphagus locisalis TaxID=305507 RepID=A0A1I7BCV6_9BACT|nr:PQQ-dependent sugar dehydrogenase [Algoriphagus locisalis]SFT85033.1 Glucose/arabinose dehydrogenase, beta-propeller fold [Algoriphagus locisalis]
MKIYLNTVLLLLTTLTSACSQENPSSCPSQLGEFIVQEAFPNLSFTRPVDFQHAGDNSNRIFVVEQRGVISVFENNAAASEKTEFLDIESKVDDSGNEEGLLGLAFHPEFQSNGYFYVNYTAGNPNRTVISRFSVMSSDPNKADPSSELVLLEFEQPYSNHNGGQISFGPDGFLYIATGDGGSGGDPQGNGQNRSTLLGKILRIDVNQTTGSNNYSIPADNPFVNNSEGFREEIYAYGLRNPWRFSFDSSNGQLWVGDVGQNKYEEIDIVENGGNYGWNTMEGFHCFKPADCDKTGLALPVWEYDHSQGDISVTGGFVYHGDAIAELEGLYIYADFVSGRIWSLDVSDPSNPINTELLNADFPISAFGVDQNQELYICGFDDKIYKLAIE